MVTFDKNKMEMMLDDILVPAVEKHSDTLNTLIENNQSYLIQAELDLIANRLEKIIRYLEEKDMNISSTFNRTSENIINISNYQELSDSRDWQHNYSDTQKTDEISKSRKAFFNMEKQTA